MSPPREWNRYDPTYRQRELTTIVDWIRRGISGSIAGLPGSGKSNFLGFISHRSELVTRQLQSDGLHTVIIPLDLNDMPDNSTATFYRVILRAFYDMRAQFPDTLSKYTQSLFESSFTSRDPFVIQTHLRDLIGSFREENIRVVLLFDRFDDFCQIATPTMINALRGLRDRYKSGLMYLMAMRQEATYIAEPQLLGELYEIIDNNVCWVSSFSHADADRVIRLEYQLGHMPEEDIAEIHALTGRFPALLKVVCLWWKKYRSHYPLPEERLLNLLAYRPIQYRLNEIVSSLSGEELSFLKRELEGGPAHQRTHHIGIKLCEKGVCRQSEGLFVVQSELLAAFLPSRSPKTTGRIWFDHRTHQFYQGREPIEDLNPLASSALTFLLENAYRLVTKEDLVNGVWPNQEIVNGVSDDSVYKLISTLRSKIEAKGLKPRYIITRSGPPERGYQFFPEGRPTNVP